MSSYPETLGALKRSPYAVPERARRSVKDEMRQNLLSRLCQSGPLFGGVIGYEDTVMPQIVNAVLSKHNFILLGLRGQAKSRILRALVTLLDDAMPIVAGSEISTHYPETVGLGMDITKQEAWTSRDHQPVRMPDFVAELIERVAFEARGDRRIDKRSGVSQRMPITVMENVVSNAERRAIVTGDTEVVPRVSDIYAALPAITGKIELEYEGELVGGMAIARELIRRAADATFQDRAGGVNTDDVIMWFDEGGALQVPEDAKADVVLDGFRVVPDLVGLVHRVGLAQEDDAPISVAACELVLEALVARKKISRSDGGQYGRATPEPRRRPNQDLFGGGLS